MQPQMLVDKWEPASNARPPHRDGNAHTSDCEKTFFLLQNKLYNFMNAFFKLF